MAVRSQEKTLRREDGARRNHDRSTLQFHLHIRHWPLLCSPSCSYLILRASRRSSALSVKGEKAMNAIKGILNVVQSRHTCRLATTEPLFGGFRGHQISQLPSYLWVLLYLVYFLTNSRTSGKDSNISVDSPFTRLIEHLPFFVLLKFIRDTSTLGARKLEATYRLIHLTGNLMNLDNETANGRKRLGRLGVSDRHTFSRRLLMFYRSYEIHTCKYKRPGYTRKSIFPGVYRIKPYASASVPSNCSREEYGGLYQILQSRK
ncbi:uncharacterized protein FOMMEDRAFT_166446 [Fomitiporia mediterranea MF3/22]|uniref:uncharacterized protein n=1 Tax=Fomitiporia mediterranea (strain MF3/22) TaxID=694068 RepID=UPI0004408057|nr:uncharacterized protein FOMMEDRAFT_166446 [Fomitiporia mediterranea MF3/22]EJD06197.1 hypothetical protein FOMMEDRAFT_166446 [Fomitiporia mediterranea MF3/22]